MDCFPPERPLYYYITDRSRLDGRSFTACVRRTLAWGVDFIQIREKDLSDRALYALARRIVALARGTGCRVLVNGRADIALAAGADGVHLPASGLGVADVKRWLPKGFLVGVSIHSLAEIRRAAAAGADYALAGHIFPTPSKEGLGPDLGLSFLARACAATPLPVFGLGGMKPESLGPVLAAGARGIAGIRLFQDREEFERLRRLTKGRPGPKLSRCGGAARR
ncbi:MAG: thiamine phosphate synthase [Acidobacteriota bacterium]|jgi:thiamine-phosphate pyrophosphorylase|nr:thiamine phosphate synthase [Acidobacteriota bacterium]NLT33376.1 thiamine phosphate synthase [Acidobacteriota bacterium]